MQLTPKQLYKLFVHRKDVFSEQQKSGAYFPVKRNITLDDLQEHLDGKKTIGLYALDTDHTVKWACVDLDGKDLRKIYPQAIIVYNLFPDFPRMLEFSGRKGYHVWVFFKNKTTADYAQTLLKARLTRVDLENNEVFPKQTTLNATRKYGNLVKVPCGIHRKNGKRSRIMKAERLSEVL